MDDFTVVDLEHAEWQVLIGKAILSFGQIELISIKCLSHIPTEPIGNTAVRLEFTRRTDLLLEILEARQNPNEALRGLIEGFKRAKELAKTRNLIAHNPVMLDIYVNVNDDHYVERTIRSARGKTAPFRIEELKEFAADVESLASSLWMQYATFVNSSKDMYRMHRDVVEKGEDSPKASKE